MTGYRNLILSPLCPQKPNSSVRNDSLRPAKASYPKAHVVHYDSMKISPTPFSSNSSGQYADIKVGRNQSWQQVYIKESTSSLHEVKVLARVRQYFPAEAIQTILAVDEENRNVSFKRFQGQTLNEIRLQYYHGQSPFHISSRQHQCRIEKWLIDLDLRRASDVLAAYQKSFRLVSSGSYSEQEICDFTMSACYIIAGSRTSTALIVLASLMVLSAVACLSRISWTYQSAFMVKVMELCGTNLTVRLFCSTRTEQRDFSPFRSPSAFETDTEEMSWFPWKWTHHLCSMLTMR